MDNQYTAVMESLTSQTIVMRVTACGNAVFESESHAITVTRSSSLGLTEFTDIVLARDGTQTCVLEFHSNTQLKTTKTVAVIGTKVSLLGVPSRVQIGQKFSIRGNPLRLSMPAILSTYLFSSCMPQKVLPAVLYLFCMAII